MLLYFTSCVIFFHNRYGSPKFSLVTIQKRFKKDDNLSTLFVPVPVKPNPDDINVGAELTGRLNKGDLLKVLNRFYQKPEIKQLALENGLDSKVIIKFESNSIHIIVVMFQITCSIKRILALEDFVLKPIHCQLIYMLLLVIFCKELVMLTIYFHIS